MDKPSCHRNDDNLSRTAQAIVETVTGEYGDALDEDDLVLFVVVAAPCGCLEITGRGIDEPLEAVEYLTDAIKALIEPLGGTLAVNISTRPPGDETRARGAAG